MINMVKHGRAKAVMSLPGLPLQLIKKFLRNFIDRKKLGEENLQYYTQNLANILLGFVPNLEQCL